MGYRVISEENEAGEQVVPTQRTRQLFQGLTFAGADEAEAALRTGFGLLGDYPETVADIRSKLSAAREAYPYSSVGYEMAGAAVPALVGGLLSGGALTAPAALRMAAIGAGESGAYEFGSGEGGAVERLRGVPEAALAGAVLSPVIGGTFQAAARGAGGFTDYLRRRFGGRASTAVEQEFQEIMQSSGMTMDEIIDRAKMGEVPADISENARKELAAYAKFIDDPSRARMRQRPVEMREKAFGETQKILTGDVDANVMASIRGGVAKAKKQASEAYDVVFDNAPKLKSPVRASIQRAMNDAPEAIGELKKVMKGDLFTVGPKNLIKLNRVPALREAEAIRRAIANKSASFYKTDMSLAGKKYDEIEKQLRVLLDDASPDLAQTRAVWSAIEKNAKHFEDGRKVFGKSADDIEIAFEAVVAQGDDAVQAFRAGLADAIRRKRGTGAGVSLPAVLGNMERKEAQIFQTIFPEDSYDEVMGLMNRAMRSQLTVNELGKSPTFERIQRERGQGIGSTITDIAEAKTFGNPKAIARLVSRAVRAIGNRLSPEEKRQVARLLIEESPDKLEAALKDSANFAAVQSLAIRAANSLQAARRSAQIGAAGVVDEGFVVPTAEALIQELISEER